MGYSSIQEIDLLLAQALTSARPDSSSSPIKLININNERDLNRIGDDTVNFYISLADSHVDGILSQMYQVPLRKCVYGQWDLASPVDEYNTTIVLSTSVNIVEGDEIAIRDDNLGIEEFAIVASITNNREIEVVTPLENTFQPGESRVMRIAFPYPVNQISARYACSYIYDKYFAAQNSPNVSDYGKEMRSYAMGQINDILNGKSILRCQTRIGNRFAAPYLYDTYGIQDRGFHTNDRNMSKP